MNQEERLVKIIKESPLFDGSKNYLDEELTKVATAILKEYIHRDDVVERLNCVLILLKKFDDSIALEELSILIKELTTKE